MRKYRFKAFNVPVAIFSIVLALMVVGLVGVYSGSASIAGYEQRLRARRSLAAAEIDPAVQYPAARYHAATYLKKQMIWAGLGLIGMGAFYLFDYRHLRRWSFWIMAACFLATCMVWIPGIGHEANGASRWLRLGPYSMQPSEFAKLGLIIYMAKMLDDRRRYIQSFFSGVLPAMIVTGALALIIVMEPDFGSAFVLCLIIFGMWLCGEMRWFHLGGLAFAAVPAAVAAILMAPYRVRRFVAFFSDDPEILMREGYQLYQSLVAIGSGGAFGLGLGQSVQKYHFLSASHTDFIFSIIAEEVGFAGTTVVILLFAALVMLGWWVALNTSDLFGSLLATGITLMVFLGASINMGVALGLLPTKGLALPLVSYGGSSLLVTLASMGILMNIAQRQFSLMSPRVEEPEG